MTKQTSPNPQDMTFRRGDLEIPVHFISAMGAEEFNGDAIKMLLVVPLILASLKPNWKIFQDEEELKKILNGDHPLARAISGINGVKKISIASDSMLLLKKEHSSWDETLGPLTEALFDAEEAVRRAKRFLEKMEKA